MFKTGIMDAENFGFDITRINYILKYIEIGSSYFKLVYYFIILLF